MLKCPVAIALDKKADNTDKNQYGQPIFGIRFKDIITEIDQEHRAQQHRKIYKAI